MTLSLTSRSRTEVWLLAYDPHFELEPKQGWPLSSASDQKRLNAIRHKGTRTQFALSRLLAQSVLAQCYGPEAETWLIGRGEKGRPLVLCHNEHCPDISISHTNGMVAFALTDTGLIGVDVEDGTRDVDIHLLAKEVFSPKESTGFQDLPIPAQRDFFFKCWTLKEGYTKALGLGLYASFRSIEINTAGPNPLVLQTPAKDDPHQPRAWRIHHHVFLNSFHTAVAHLAESSCTESAAWQSHRLSLELADRKFNVIRLISDRG